MRHGETTADKSNSYRGLTVKGISQIKRNAILLETSISDEVIILHSRSHRAKQSAQILSKSFCNSLCVEDDFRILNVDKLQREIDNAEKKGERMAMFYINYPNNLLELREIETPHELCLRWQRIFNRFSGKDIVCISHEGSLDAFLRFQESYLIMKPLENDCFEYGDFAVLESKLLVGLDNRRCIV